MHRNFLWVVILSIVCGSWSGCGGEETKKDAALDGSAGPIDTPRDASPRVDARVEDAEVNAPSDAATQDASDARDASDASDASDPSCDDHDRCTVDSSGANGTCVHLPVVCMPADSCHAAGSCNASTGKCSTPAKQNGTSCDDSNACTQTDACQGGTCTGTNPVTCAASDQCHSAGTCNTSTGACSNPAKSDGASCDDSDACTQTDGCQSGVCIGSNPVTCSAQDQCHLVGTCNSTTGICSQPEVPDGISCNDDNACTQTDACQDGACTGTNPIVCPTPDQCHELGECDSSTGACDNPTKPDGEACDDGDACTQTDDCRDGACAGTNPVVCPTPDQCHELGECDSSTGTCDNPTKLDGEACDDDDACTQTDNCQSGACAGTNPVVCPTPDQCHDPGECDSSTGACDNPAKTDGVACDDSNVCSTPDTCQSGVCAGPNTCPSTLYTEDFQSMMFPSDWFRFNVDGATPTGQVSYVTNAWIVREDFNFNVADYAAFSTSWYTPTSAADDWMVTEAIALPAGGGGCTLNWNAVSFDPAYRDSYEVRVFTAAPVQATLVASSTLLTSVALENSTWTARTASLAAYTGQTVYIAWRNNSNDRFLLLVDDIVVTCL